MIAWLRLPPCWFVSYGFIAAMRAIFFALMPRCDCVAKTSAMLVRVLPFYCGDEGYFLRPHLPRTVMSMSKVIRVSIIFRAIVSDLFSDDSHVLLSVLPVERYFQRAMAVHWPVKNNESALSGLK